MSHYAKVLDRKVIQVIVAEKDFFKTFVDSSAGDWIQTSYNTIGGKHTQGGIPLRGNYAGIGYTYDRTNDVFYPPQPYPSWTIEAPTWTWTPPIPFPIDGNKYNWDETTKTWVAL
jgi:hypothetical protein